MRTRDAIVQMLATCNATASEIANQLNIPKQIVYYHLEVLSREGVVTVKDIMKRSGRFRARVYGLRHGRSVITVPNPEKVLDTRRWLEDYYLKHLKSLTKRAVDTSMLRQEFTLFMYHVMRICSELTGIDQNSIFKEYGDKIASEIVIPLIKIKNLNSGRHAFRKALFLLDKIIDGGLSIMGKDTKTTYIIHFKTFLASSRYDARIDGLFISFLEKIAQTFLKGKTVVEKYPSKIVTSYSYLVKRVDVKDF